MICSESLFGHLVLALLLALARGVDQHGVLLTLCCCGGGGRALLGLVELLHELALDLGAALLPPLLL